MTTVPPPTFPEPVTGEISALIAQLHETSQRLEELTSGQIDTVSDTAGRTFVLRRAQEDLRRSEGHRQVAILNALPARIALLDAEGIVVSVNEGWRRFSDTNELHGRDYGVGSSYLTICDQVTRDDSLSAQGTAEVIRGVLVGATQSASIEYPCHSQAERRWFLMTAAPLSAELRGGAVVMHSDITERKRAEDILRLATQQVVRGQRKQVRAELLILIAAAVVFFGLSVQFDWFEASTKWVLNHQAEKLDEVLFTMFFVIAGLTVFAFRRWRESESELALRHRSHAVTELLREELERRIALRTEELRRTNQSLNDEIAERKRSALAAERALQRLSEAQRIGQIGDWEWDLVTHAISWSPQVFEILGRDPRLGPPQDYLEHNALYEEASQAVLAENVALVIESGNPRNYELRARRPNGVRVDVLGRAAARKDESGRTVGLYGTVQDISEQQRSAAALAESESRFRQMAESIDDVFFLQSFDFSKIHYVSPGYERIWGRTCASLYENPASWAASFHPDDLHLAVAQLEGPNNQRFDYEFRIIRPDGDVRWIHVKGFPIPGSLGEPYLTAGIGSDVTRRKRSEAAARESERRYHSLFENMLEGYAYCETIFEQDVLSDFIYLEVNTAFGTLTGLKDVVGKRVSEVIPGFLETNKEFLELYGRVALSGRPEKREAFATGPDVWLSITAYSSSREQFVAVFDNITNRKSAEDALRGSAELLKVERGRLVMAQHVAKVGSWETELSTGNVVWSEETHRIHETDPSTFRPGHSAYLAFVHPDDREGLAEEFARSIVRKSGAVIEHRVLLSEGRIKIVEERWQVVVDDGGKPVRAVGTCQDITERKTAEEKIIHLSRVQAMRSGISSLIVRVRDRGELFKEGCRIAVEAGGFRMSLIAIVDPKLERIIPIASAGKDEGLIAAVNDLLSRPDVAPRTMVARAIREKRAILSNDSRTDPAVLLGSRYAESAIRSIAVLPLIISDEAVGVLALYSSEAGFFLDEETKLLTELADDIAFGLSSIRAHAEREEADEALRTSLKDKEALLKEVHHRVKNNMQVITSLLRLESNRIDHATTKSVLKDMQNRIQAMAALHEAVYRSDNFSQVDLGVYLKQLTGQLSRSLVPVPGQVSFRLDLFSVALDLDQAIPCGLIVNELASNALKHAFPGGRQGEVRIELQRMGEEKLRLRITDNGIGLPPNFKDVRAKSLGLQLVADLARQIGGNLHVGPGPEALFEVTFSPNHK